VTEYDLAVDFIDMTNDRHLWTHLEDTRRGFVPIAGRSVVVGCEDIPAVAKISRSTTRVTSSSKCCPAQSSLTGICSAPGMSG
jgi:hypothetical protein